MNKVIFKELDFRDKRHCLAEARREIKDLVLDPTQVYYLYYKAPNNNDLVVISQEGLKWEVRKATNSEFNRYFDTYINNKIK